MNIPDIMECLSRNYLETIANRTGYFNLQGKDFGTDLHICKANVIDRGRYQRLLMTGRQVQIQVKSVQEHLIRPGDQHISYDLETKNYDDLIDRRNELGSLIPLILVVFIFPTNQEQWLTLTAEELIIRKRAYWYMPDESVGYTPNSTSQVIHIPSSNLIDMNFFPMIFNYFN
jgi:hypothetical protein